MPSPDRSASCRQSGARCACGRWRRRGRILRHRRIEGHHDAVWAFVESSAAPPQHNDHSRSHVGGDPPRSTGPGTTARVSGLVSVSSSPATSGPAPPRRAAWPGDVPSTDVWTPTGLGPSTTTTMQHAQPLASRWRIVSATRRTSQGISESPSRRLSPRRQRDAQSNPPSDQYLDDDDVAVAGRRDVQPVEVFGGEGDCRDWSCR